MPHPITHRPEERRDRRQKRRERRKKAREAARSSASGAADATPAGPEPEVPAPVAEAAPSASETDALAGFALLADPSTIAGVAAPPEPAPEAESDEVERLRAALHMRSQEIEALQQKWQAPEAREASPGTEHEADAMASPSDETVEPPARTLLDAASARRLAADARKRERESRAALEKAQKALGVVRPEPRQPSAPATDRASEPGSSGSGWQRRPVVARNSTVEHAEPARPSRTRPAATTGPLALLASPTPATAPGSRSEAIRPNPSETAPSEARAATRALDADETILGLGRKLQIARAELREHESTLALARERTRGLQDELKARRTELGDLRTLLGERDATIEERDAQIRALEGNSRGATEHPHPSDSTTLASDEVERLRARVSALDAELQTRGAERARLEAALGERNALDDTRRDQLEAMQDRLEAQDRALDAARREYELERSRHSRSLELITRLRATLTSDLPVADAAIAVPITSSTTAPTTSIATPIATSPTPGPTAAQVAPPESELRAISPIDGASASARVFAYWLDDQVRRHFGPMGIDRFSDLLRAPLARRHESIDRPASILLVGRGVRHLAPEFAEALVSVGPDRFEIHVADTNADASHDTLPIETPIGELLVQQTAPADPSAFADLIHATQADVIVSLSLLTHEADPTAWLEVLRDASERRVALLFAEATGASVSTPPADVAAIGDRIWSLMPDRYTRLDDGTVCRSWQDAFAACPQRPRNALCEALRARFRPELSAQFGFLAEPFLRAGIASNFDVTAERDRRFLAQVADLDERRIEAGAAPALHTIALIDILAEE